MDVYSREIVFQKIVVALRPLNIFLEFFWSIESWYADYTER